MSERKVCIGGLTKPVENPGRTPRIYIGGPPIERTTNIQQPPHPEICIVLADRRYDTEENNGESRIDGQPLRYRRE